MGRFAAAQAKLTQDLADFAQFRGTLAKHKRGTHVAKVYHLKAQNALGAGFVEAFMEKQCSFEVVEDTKIDNVRNTAPRQRPDICLGLPQTPPAPRPDRNSRQPANRPPLPPACHATARPRPWPNVAPAPPDLPARPTT